jgi:hypothetical protein
VTWSYWRKTTRHHSTGPQLSSPKPIQRKIPVFVLSHLGTPREHLNVQLQKFVPTHVWIVNCSSFSSGGGRMYTQGQIFCIHVYFSFYVLINVILIL